MQGNGAWTAAGWSGVTYWTGEVHVGGYNALIVNQIGNDGPYPVDYDRPVVCLRP